jgi:hypothetical protein
MDGDYHAGAALMPGIYEHDGELNIDLDEYIRACGGDPASKADRRTACRVIARVCAEHGIDCIEVN